MKLLTSIRDPECELCKLHRSAVDVCITGSGPVPARVMVVGKMPNSRTYQEALLKDLAQAGFTDCDEWFFTQALKCRNFDQSSSNLDVKQCKPYLDREIAAVHPEWILALGNEALFALTGHSGIMKYRGRAVELASGLKIFPTISPSSVARNPGQRQGYAADLMLFRGETIGAKAKIALPKIAFVETVGSVKKLGRLLDRGILLSYDIETRGRDEFDPQGCIVSLSGTMEIEGRDTTMTWAMPLSHPQSPFRSRWRQILEWLAPHFTQPKKQVAHNGKFDARWLRRHGIPGATVTFDTMLAAHLLDENRQKGLKPQAASRLGVAPWAISTRDLWSTPLREVLIYNALDTYYTYHIYQDIRRELIAQPRLTRIFQKILMPANEVLIGAENRGVWVDRERLATNSQVATRMVDEIDGQLGQWIPDTEVTTEWPIYKSGKRVGVNWNPSIFSKWMLFEHLKLPILDRGKEKPDGTEGDPSMKEAVMLELKGTHPIVDVLLNRAGWIKNSQFLKAYSELADEDDRLHTNFKLTGTVTGRLSSGKADADKVTAAPKGGMRGLNLQQVPREEFVRGVIGSPPGWVWVEVDFSQAELRIGGFLSRDKTIIRLYQMGEDIHTATAMWVLGLPKSQVTKDQRKKAKAVNFGFLYGMGAPKFVKTAFENYEAVFTLDEARGIRRQFFERFSGLQAWHARQRRLAHQNGRVVSPLGRIRHLPDINSEDEMVVAEAERQAINSPVQGFASDMNLLGMIETCRLAKGQGIRAYVVATIHDATAYEVHEDDVAKFLPLLKEVYENLPLKRKFGVDLDVPIVADLKVGRYWGGSRELTTAEVMNWNGEGLE